MGVFRFEVLDGQIGLLTFDTPDRKGNTLGRSVLEELTSVIDELEPRTDPSLCLIHI